MENVYGNSNLSSNVMEFEVWLRVLPNSLTSQLPLVVTEKLHISANSSAYFWVLMTVHREQSVKREDQQDATIRCLLLTSVSKCFIVPIFRRTKALLLHLVCCSGSAGCGW